MLSNSPHRRNQLLLRIGACFLVGWHLVLSLSESWRQKDELWELLECELDECELLECELDEWLLETELLEL